MFILVIINQETYAQGPQHISSALSLGYAVDPVYKFFRFLFCNKIAYQIIFGDIVDLVRSTYRFF